MIFFLFGQFENDKKNNGEVGMSPTGHVTQTKVAHDYE